MEDVTNEGGAGTVEVASLATERAAEPLVFDRVYELLSDSRRRYLVRLLGTESEASLSDAAAKIAAWEASGVDREPSDEASDGVFVSLWHVHLPKLGASGVIGFDEATEILSLGANAGQVLGILDLVGEKSLR